MDLAQQLQTRRETVLARLGRIPTTDFRERMLQLHSLLLPDPNQPEHVKAAARLAELSFLSTRCTEFIPIDGNWFRIIKKRGDRRTVVSGESHKANELIIVQIQCLDKGKSGSLPTGATYIKFEKLAKEAGVKAIKILKPEYNPLIFYHTYIQSNEVAERLTSRFRDLARTNNFKDAGFYWTKDL